MGKKFSMTSESDPFVYIMMEFYDRRRMELKTKKSTIDELIKLREANKEGKLKEMLKNVYNKHWWLGCALSLFLHCGNMCDIKLTNEIHPVAQWKKGQKASVSVSDDEFIEYIGFALSKDGAKLAMLDARGDEIMKMGGEMMKTTRGSDL